MKNKNPRIRICLIRGFLYFTDIRYSKRSSSKTKAFGKVQLIIQERLGVLVALRRVRSTFLFARLRSAGSFYSACRLHGASG